MLHARETKSRTFASRYRMVMHLNGFVLCARSLEELALVRAVPRSLVAVYRKRKLSRESRLIAVQPMSFISPRSPRVEG